MDVARAWDESTISKMSSFSLRLHSQRHSLGPKSQASWKRAATYDLLAGSSRLVNSHGFEKTLNAILVTECDISIDGLATCHRYRGRSIFEGQLHSHTFAVEKTPSRPEGCFLVRMKNEVFSPEKTSGNAQTGHRVPCCSHVC